MSFCINCGVKLDKSNDFCVKCGAKIEQNPIPDAGVIEKEAGANKLNQSFNPEVKSTTPYKFIIFGVVLTMLFGVFTFFFLNPKLDQILVLNKSLEKEKRLKNTNQSIIGRLENQIINLESSLYSLENDLKNAKKIKRKKVRSDLLKYEQSNSYVKYGNWFREETNDVFDGKKWTAITSGIIKGKGYVGKGFKKAPLLKINNDYRGFSIENINKFIELSYAFNTSGIIVNMVVLDSEGDKMFREGCFAKRASWCDFIKFGEADFLNLNVYQSNDFLNLLKKGNKLLIKIIDYDDKTYDDFYFEYSLSGSSKALAD